MEAAGGFFARHFRRRACGRHCLELQQAVRENRAKIAAQDQEIAGLRQQNSALMKSVALLTLATERKVKGGDGTSMLPAPLPY